MRVRMSVCSEQIHLELTSSRMQFVAPVPLLVLSHRSCVESLAVWWVAR